jgi:HEAT repeat protein
MSKRLHRAFCESSQPESGYTLGTNILVLVMISVIVGIWLPFLSIAVGWKVLLTLGTLVGVGALRPTRSQEADAEADAKRDAKLLLGLERLGVGALRPTRSVNDGPLGNSRAIIMSVVSTRMTLSEARRILATSSDSDERLDAATALGKTGSQQVVPALAEALSSDQDQYVRHVCASALGSIKGAEAEKALLQAMADPEPYVQQAVKEALSRLGTEQANRAIGGARKTTKKVKNRLCPFLTESGMCEPPGVIDWTECSWETQGSGHYHGCFVYRMHQHPGGPADFIRSNL